VITWPVATSRAANKVVVPCPDVVVGAALHVAQTPWVGVAGFNQERALGSSRQRRAPLPSQGVQVETDDAPVLLVPRQAPCPPS